MNIQRNIFNWYHRYIFQEISFKYNMVIFIQKAFTILTTESFSPTLVQYKSFGFRENGRVIGKSRFIRLYHINGHSLAALLLK